MKSRILAILTALVILLQFAACGKGRSVIKDEIEDESTCTSSQESEPEESDQPDPPPDDTKTKQSESSGSWSSGAVNVPIENTPPENPPVHPPDSLNPSTVFTPLAASSYWCYNQLTSNGQREAYNIINNTVLNMTEGLVELPVKSTHDLIIAYTAVRNDFPQYFWMPSKYLYGVNPNGNISIIIKGDGKNPNQAGQDYNCSVEERNSLLAQQNQAISEAIAFLGGERDQYTIELMLHDWLLGRVSYNHGANPYTDYTALGALVTGQAVCEGYARAFQLLLYNVGIESTLVVGSSRNEPHMWNIARIDGQWYNVDTTWNDGERISHTYFNQTDAFMQQDHFFEQNLSQVADADAVELFNFNLPSCASVAANYGRRNNVHISNDEEFKTLIANGIVNAINSGLGHAEFVLDHNYRAYPNVSAVLSAANQMGCFASANARVAPGSQIYGNIGISGKGSEVGYIIGFTLYW
ncbi:MAG: hypothetical protein FWH14_02405 [Oscillospiraceae bacterium]|nr:hypothetical protein [Oscillospiraceae bacterium]